MLALTRQRNQEVSIDGDVGIIEVQGSHVRLGVKAPDDVPVFREELCDAEFDFGLCWRVLCQAED